MASFPAPFPTNNPYIGAAAEAGSAAARLAEGLRAAYVQQQGQIQRQQQAQVAQDHQDQQDRFHALQDGWIPANDQGQRIPVGPGSVPGAGGTKGLIPRSSGSNQDPGRIQTIGGQRFYKPTDEESGKSVTLSEDLAKSYRDAGLTNAKAGVQYPGTMIQHFNQVLDMHNKAAEPEPLHFDLSGNFKDENGDPMAAGIGLRTRKVYKLDMGGTSGQQGGEPGGPFDGSDQMDEHGKGGGAAPASAFRFAPPEKPERPDRIRVFDTGYSSPFTLDTNTRETTPIKLPPGVTPALSASQAEADKDRHQREADRNDAREQRRIEAEQRRADAQAKVEEQFARNHEAAGVKKDAMQAMAQGYWDAKGTEPNGTYFPPRYVNGIVVPGPPAVMPEKGDRYDARIKELETMARGFEKTAKTHQAEQERIEKARGWGRFAPAQQPAQAAPAAGPGRGAKADPLGIR